MDEASKKYNCHAYAWHLTEGNANKVWINAGTGNNNLSQYWNTNVGCFVQVSEGSSSMKKIHYYDGDHSAVKSTTFSGKYESKWGQLPLVGHYPSQVPYTNPSNRRYYGVEIVGLTLVPCSGTTTYSIPQSSSLSYSWSVSAGLQISSGQGTNTIAVSAGTSSSRYGTVYLSLNGQSYSKNVTIGALDINAISGPTSLTIPANASYVYGSFTASPNNSPNATYTWTISPNGSDKVDLSIDRFNLGVYFKQPGTYAITCYVSTSCVPYSPEHHLRNLSVSVRLTVPNIAFQARYLIK
ncbi:MAG: hypothetical protein LBK65_08350 [Tannerellaceae bacterium]|nr:hypothetical protein [Tannerellaceae bacterium]